MERKTVSLSGGKGLEICASVYEPLRLEGWVYFLWVLWVKPYLCLLRDLWSLYLDSFSCIER